MHGSNLRGYVQSSRERAYFPRPPRHLLPLALQRRCAARLVVEEAKRAEKQEAARVGVGIKGEAVETEVEEMEEADTGTG